MRRRWRECLQTLFRTGIDKPPAKLATKYLGRRPQSNIPSHLPKQRRRIPPSEIMAQMEQESNEHGHDERWIQMEAVRDVDTSGCRPRCQDICKAVPVLMVDPVLGRRSSACMTRPECLPTPSGNQIQVASVVGGHHGAAGCLMQEQMRQPFTSRDSFGCLSRCMVHA